MTPTADFLRGLRRSLAAVALALAVSTAAWAEDPFTLTVLHSNDSESYLLPDGSRGGIANFVAAVNETRAAAINPITICSGDLILPGIYRDAGYNDGVDYDAMATDRIGYDAIILGNHDFDENPDVTAQFITDVQSYGTTVPFLSSNLDFSGHTGLQAHVTSGVLGKSTVLTVDGQEIGIVGATTETLPSITTLTGPGGTVTVDPVVAAAQAEIDALTTSGVNKIIFVSHLQSINNDMTVVDQLTGVDLAIAGGGHELLADGDDVLHPYQSPQISEYPKYTPGGVPVVTTSGRYDYLGKLVVHFDAAGNVLSLGGEPEQGVIRVNAEDRVPDAAAQADIETPVQAYVDVLMTTRAGTIADAQGIDGRRSSVRTMETNEGNLCADSLLWYARKYAAQYGVPMPTIAIQNGGGIRNDSVLTGELTLGQIKGILPFDNFVSAKQIDAPTLVGLLENAVSQVEFTSGRFGQIAGMSFVWDDTLAPGDRVVEVSVDTTGDGVQNLVLVEDGDIVAGHEADLFTIASIDFLFKGGDDYDFGPGGYTAIGSAKYADALYEYVVSTDGLDGVIGSPAYGWGGEGRVTRVPEPATLVLVFLGAAVLVQGRRRKRLA